MLSCLEIYFWFHLLSTFLNEFMCCILRLFGLSWSLYSNYLLYHRFLIIFELYWFIFNKNFSGSFISLKTLELMINSHWIYLIFNKRFDFFCHHNLVVCYTRNFKVLYLHFVIFAEDYFHLSSIFLNCLECSFIVNLKWNLNFSR